MGDTLRTCSGHEEEKGHGVEQVAHTERIFVKVALLLLHTVYIWSAEQDNARCGPKVEIRLQIMHPRL